MSQTAPPESDFSPIGSLTERSKNIQLAIVGAIVIFIIVIAGVALYVRYRPKSYKPNKVNVTTSIYLVDSKAAKATLALRNPVINPNSKFMSMILQDTELKSLLVQNGTAAIPLKSTNVHVYRWPKQAHTINFTAPYKTKDSEALKGSQAPRVTGSIDAEYGTRLEEGMPMFRVEMQTKINLEVKETSTTQIGLIHYEGDLPNGHLIYVRDLGYGLHETIVIDTK